MISTAEPQYKWGGMASLLFDKIGIKLAQTQSYTSYASLEHTRERAFLPSQTDEHL